MRVLFFSPVLLWLLVALLLLEAPTPTAAAKLLRLHKKQQHATATDSGGGTGDAPDTTRPRTRPVRAPHNVTITQEENGVVVNATLPSECLPVEQHCLDDELTPLVDAAHNSTASDEEKNAVLQSFCASECGQNYTAHVTAILQGSCMTTLPPRLSDEGPSYNGSDASAGIIISTPRANVSVGGDGVRVRVGLRQRGGGGDDDDNHDQDDHDDDDDDDDDDDQNDHLTRSPEEQQAYDRRVWERFQKDRPGSSLGCIVSQDGEYCAAKQGCEFFNSCCYASWVRLAGFGGYMLSARSMRNIEYLCPGSVRFLGVDGCT